jgi:hypothetical protein
MRALIFSLLILIFSDCTHISDHPIIAVKIYDHQGNLEELFGEFRSLGINTLFVSPELARKPVFMELAEMNSIPVFLIVPTFYNPEALAEDSSLYAVTAGGEKAVDDWVEFICPNRKEYRKHHLEDLKSLIKEISPAGISIDFIRYFVFWERVYPDQTIADLPKTCFDDTCLAAFTELYEIPVPDDKMNVEEKAAYILRNHRSQWTEFKVNTITSYVSEITQTLNTIDPDLEFNLHLVPWTESDFDGAIRKVAGQDVADLAPLVDFISPMCYSHMVRQPPGWIHEVVSNIDQNGQGKVLPSIQVSRSYLEDPFPAQSFQEALRAALKFPSRGVIFWSWEALEQDSQKLEVVRREVMTE